jgi:hypothetical protein
MLQYSMEMESSDGSFNSHTSWLVNGTMQDSGSGRLFARYQ